MPDTITATPAGDGVKLTKAQIAAGQELIAKGPQRWSDTWPPARGLVEKGIATREAGRLSSPKFTITPAGRAHPALATADNGGRDDGR